MSTLQVSNLHFESTGNNRLQYTGSNAYNLVAGGTIVATINTISFNANVSLFANTIELGNASDTTITRVSAGVIAVEGSTVAQLGTNGNLTAGFTATAVDDGTKSSGTYTPTPSGGNFRRAVNGGAHTLAAPTASGDYTMIIQYTNNGSAGAITLSGFSKTGGDAFTTVNGDDFLVSITKINGFTHAIVSRLQ